ncbi:hypothetical protein IPZ68_32340 [Streptomyces arenae]|nr:hypothetical protein [Streptomyces arenae]
MAQATSALEVMDAARQILAKRSRLLEEHLQLRSRHEHLLYEGLAEAAAHHEPFRE